MRLCSNFWEELPVHCSLRPALADFALIIISRATSKVHVGGFA